MYKENIKSIPKENLYCGSTIGMRDYVKDIGGSYEYEKYWCWVIDNSRLEKNGLLEPDGVMSGSLGWHGINYNTAYIKGYNKYLCKDGVIRYRKSKGKELEIQRGIRELCDEDFERFNRFYENQGFTWVEEDYCWRNPATGEEVGY